MCFRQPTLVTICLAALLGVTSSATAQQSIQTGDGLLMIRGSMPQEARTGESFTFTIEVTNNSDNVTLHDIKLKQRETEGFSIESVSMKSDKQRQSASGQGNQESNQQDQGSSESENQDQEDQDQNEDEDAGDNQDSQGDQNGQDNREMTIETLKPGKSRTFVIQAAADQEGELKNCIAIVSYTPAMCLTSQVVKPELELTKTAPERTSRCEVIELVYTLTNDGSGDVGPIEITDDLGDGLATIEGDNQLKFQVDGLTAGDTRKFIARVYAQEAGEFSSRAEAKATDSDLSSRSKETTTKVVAADLDVRIEGPSRSYGDDIATFTAMVTNTGNYDAENVRVLVKWPRQANLVDRGEVSFNKSRQQSSSQERQIPTPVSETNNQNGQSSGDDQDSGNDQGSENNQSNSQMEMSEEEFRIDSLAAGQTAEFEYAIRPRDLESIPTEVEARYVCAIDAADDAAEARSEITSQAMTTVKLVRLPALQIVVVDSEDPVADGGEVVYTIRIWNEGHAEDQNLELKANLPEGLEFASAEGPTEHSHEDSTVTFEPLENLQPGDRVDYKVTAKSSGQGTVRFEVELTSEAFSDAIRVEEPTQLFSRQASN